VLSVPKLSANMGGSRRNSCAEFAFNLHLTEGIASFEEDEELQLNAGRQAMAVITRSAFSLSGAGAGKTTVLQVILTLRNKWECRLFRWLSAGMLPNASAKR
jgi:hypothetical protein